MTWQTIRRLISEILGQDEELITPETKLWRSLDAVSLGKLFLACERRFKITIHDEAASSFKRAKDLARYVEQRVAEGRDDFVQPDDTKRDAWYYE